MTKLYLLWYHDEYGPEDLKATLDADRVVALAKTFDTDGWFDRIQRPDILDRLQELMNTDPPVGITNLMDGWGGLHLQIVELE